MGAHWDRDSHPDRLLCANHVPGVPPTQGSQWEHPPAGSWGPSALSLAAPALCWEPPDQTLPVQGFSSPGSPAPLPARVPPAAVVGQTGVGCPAGCETQWSQDSRAKNTNYIRLPGRGRSSCQDCSLVHLKLGRMKDGSILSRKTQGPPGGSSPGPLSTQAGKGSLSRGQGLPCPGVRCPVARAGSASATPPAPPSGEGGREGGLPRLRLQATPLLGRQPRPAPLPVAALP